MLQTKLYRPSIYSDILFRQERINDLELGVKKPLTLVSAPAGYGKSILISTWLEQKKHKHAWISLGKSENNLNSFIEYLYQALRLVFPNSFKQLLEYASALEIDSVKNLASDLINEINAIDEEFILVLDDFHLIENQNILNLINVILKYPPEGFHLVIITRVDPPLNISSLRAHGRLNEVRMTQLAFNEKEVKELLENQDGLKADNETATALYSSTEGWVTGLHLCLLAYKQGADYSKSIEKITPNTIWISDFLYQEVFLKQDEYVQQFLLYSSLFDRYCADLLDELIGDPSQKKSDQAILKMREANLFVVNLDSELKWFRYHHLFNDLLLEIKGKLISEEKEKEILLKAAHWFESEGLLDESIECFTKSNDYQEVVRIIDEYYSELFMNGDLNVVQRWIDQLPEDIRSNNPVVLMTKAWIAYGSFKMELIPALLEKIEAEMKNHPQTSIVQEVNFMKANIFYWTGDAETAAKYLDEIRENTKGIYNHLTSNTIAIWAIANHSLGNDELIKAELHADLYNCPPSDLSRQGYIHAALAFDSLLSGNLKDAKTAGYRMKNVTDIHTNANIKAWKNYILGCAHIQELNTEKSIEQFTSAAKHKLLLDQRAVVDALAMVALSNRLEGNLQQARKAGAELEAFVKELNDPFYTILAKSCLTRLALIDGELLQDQDWMYALPIEIANASLFLWNDVPEITKVRFLLVKGGNAALQEADALLKTLLAVAQDARFKFHEYDILVLQAIYLNLSGKTKLALETLDACISEASGKGWVRPFVEPGPLILPLLDGLLEQEKHVDAINKFKRHLEVMLVELPSDTVSSEQNQLISPLTQRELETLKLLEQGLRNKEIANQMFVSVDAVKKNLYRIFQKLDVHSRVELIAKSQAMGLTEMAI